MRLRFLLARDAVALSDALNLFVRALFAFQRRRPENSAFGRPTPELLPSFSDLVRPFS